jgi:serpin B
LRSLGVRRIFGAVPPLAVTALVTGEPLYVSGAFHQTVLRVDERGVEGAAATGVVARAISVRTLPEAEMRVDRPFYFLVIHRDTGSVLFSSQVARP